MNTPLDFEQSLTLLSHRAGLFRLDGVNMFVMQGADCKKHLHSFCTNEILKAQPNQVVEAFILDVKGKCLGHVFALIGEQDIRVFTCGSNDELLIQHLDKYVIREDVEFISRSHETAFFWLDGEAVQDVFQSVFDRRFPDRNACSEFSIDEVSVSAIQCEMNSTSGCLLVVSSDHSTQLVELFAAQGIELCTNDLLEYQRIATSIPRLGREIDQNRLPQELCRDAQAISFTKGCYLGQETVARIDALGRVNWQLAKLKCSATVDSSTEFNFEVDGKSIGKVTSLQTNPVTHESLALAILRRGYEKAGMELRSGDLLWTVVE